MGKTISRESVPNNNNSVDDIDDVDDVNNVNNVRNIHYSSTNSRQYDYLFKITICGDSGVGKSSILKKIINDDFCSVYSPTCGVDFGTKTFDLNKSKTGDPKLTKAKLQLWDVSGDPRFNTVADLYFKTHCLVIVFDLTNYTTFKNIDRWFEKIKKQSKNAFVVLIGTKHDLASNCTTHFLGEVVKTTETVPESEIYKWCDDNRVIYYRVSSKNDFSDSQNNITTHDCSDGKCENKQHSIHEVFENIAFHLFCKYDGIESRKVHLCEKSIKN